MTYPFQWQSTPDLTISPLIPVGMYVYSITCPLTLTKSLAVILNLLTNLFYLLICDVERSGWKQRPGALSQHWLLSALEVDSWSLCLHPLKSASQCPSWSWPPKFLNCSIQWMTQYRVCSFNSIIFPKRHLTCSLDFLSLFDLVRSDLSDRAIYQNIKLKWNWGYGEYVWCNSEDWMWVLQIKNSCLSYLNSIITVVQCRRDSSVYLWIASKMFITSYRFQSLKPDIEDSLFSP